MGQSGFRARAHQARPQDTAIAIAYSRRLRTAGKLDAAAAVLEATASGQQDDRMLLVERGLHNLTHVVKLMTLSARFSNIFLNAFRFSMVLLPLC